MAMITTYDPAAVRSFTDDIGTQLGKCQLEMGEGVACTQVAAILRGFAGICRTLCDRVRDWGDAVFIGRSEFDPEVERLWKEAGEEVLPCARWALECGRNAEPWCYQLDGMNEIRAAINDLDRLLRLWVTPQLAVGPAARRWRDLDQAPTDEARQRVASLPPLPAGWEPEDPEHRARFQRPR